MRKKDNVNLNDFENPALNDPTVLREINRRLSTGLRESDQEKNELKKQMQDMVASNQKVKKDVENLCTLIITKSKGTKDEKPEFKMSLEQRIEAASVAADTYFSSLKDEIESTKSAAREMLSRTKERTKQIANQTKEIEELKIKNKEAKGAAENAIKEFIGIVGDRVDVGRITGEQYEKIVNTSLASIRDKYGISIPVSPYTARVKVEQSDNVSYYEGETGKNARDESTMQNNSPGDPLQDSSTPGNSSSHGENTDENRQGGEKKPVAVTFPEEMEDEDKNEVIKLADALTNNDRLIIRAMGESGLSKSSDIGRVINNSKDTVAISTLNGRLKYLNERGLIQTGKANIPNPRTCTLTNIYRLSNTGQKAYQYLFGDEPKKSEWTVLVENHSSLDHGYGIKATAIMLRDSEWLKEKAGKEKPNVFAFTRRKEFEIHVPCKMGETENPVYVPDIVILYKSPKTGRMRRMCFEYETGACSDQDMVDKLNKAACVLREVYFVTPTEDIATATAKKIKAWRSQVDSHPDYPYLPIRIHITACTRFSKSSKKPFTEITGLRDYPGAKGAVKPDITQEEIAGTIPKAGGAT